MPSTARHVCMLAAENGAVPGGKVGGIGDVIRELPNALAGAGVRTSILTPAYGCFHQLSGSRLIGEVQLSFAGQPETLSVHRLATSRPEGVQDYVIEHPLFSSCGAGVIYCDDGANRPFAQDATRFALFVLGALYAVRDGLIGDVELLHLHDWHAAMAVMLQRHGQEFASIAHLPSVFSIHNLALQGIRPLSGDESSLAAWYPGFVVPHSEVADPRWTNCINPMATAIRACNVIHTVSPHYAEEILQPNDAARAFHGGEGLEVILQRAQVEGRLHGILNGIEYRQSEFRREPWPAFCQILEQRLLSVVGAREGQLQNIDFLAHQRLRAWSRSAADTPRHLLTSVGRLTEQKLALLLQVLDDGRTVLDALLDRLGTQGRFILLGSGDAALEKQCQQIAARRKEFLFLNLYDESIADRLYAQGDLFLMPSAFEPCGISQLLSMRQGQPVLAHAVGGLCDTVEDGSSGFLFSAESRAAQGEALLARLDQVLQMRELEPQRWQGIVQQALSVRFDWQDSARQYRQLLYTAAGAQ